MKNKKPIIGITTDLKDNHNSIEESYSKAVINYGGLPLLIPTTKNKSHLEEIVKRIDGLLLPGSRDMDPKFYNEKPHPKLREMSLDRTETEFFVTEKAIEQKIPVFGICGGMQFLNVFFGGSLYQDIEALIENHLNHEKGAVHEVKIKKESNLAKSVSKSNFEVKSYHHQAVNKLGTGVAVNAESPDGIVEGIEHKDLPVLGIQWHPELEETILSKQIFEYFLANCDTK